MRFVKEKLSEEQLMEIAPHSYLEGTEKKGRIQLTLPTRFIAVLDYYCGCRGCSRAQGIRDMMDTFWGVDNIAAVERRLRRY